MEFNKRPPRPMPASKHVPETLDLQSFNKALNDSRKILDENLARIRRSRMLKAKDWEYRVSV